MTIIVTPEGGRIWRQSGATRFDASGDYLFRTTGLLDYNSPYTMMQWWHQLTDDNATATFMQISTSSGSDKDQFIIGSSGTVLGLQIVGTGAGANVGSTFAPPVTMHLTMVRESATSLKGYLNGVLDMTNTGDTTGRGAAGFQRLSTTSTAWPNARVWAPMEWSVALTQDEIRRQMHSLIPRVRLDKLHAWHPGLPFTVSRTKDYSGNGRNWTENGTLTTERGGLLWTRIKRQRFYIIGAAPITLDAGKGDLTLTPRTATFQTKLAANNAALTAAPRTAALNTTLATAPAQVATTGRTATLNTTLAANKGSLSLAGGAAQLKTTLAAGQGAISTTARTAAFNTALTAGRGQLTVIGRDAALNLGGDVTLAASVGTISLAGQATAFTLKQVSNTAALALAGQTATFKLNLSASEGGIVVTPRGVTFATNMQAGMGTLPLAGGAAVFQHLFAVGKGAILLTGRQADLVILSTGTPAVITAYDRALIDVTSSEQGL
jgi:hypothetical protein